MTKHIAKFLLRFYQAASASSLPTCRFQPTCSQYAYQAIDKYGLAKGSLLALRRILACHPFSRRPYYDPT